MEYKIKYKRWKEIVMETKLNCKEQGLEDFEVESYFEIIEHEIKWKN